MTPVRAAILALVTGACLLLPGCIVLGIVADKVAGDRPIPPAYAPDPLKPILVIAENYRNPSSNLSDAERIQILVGDRLTQNKVAPVIPDDSVRAVRDRSPSAYRKMSIVEIAKAVGAEQVVYIDITSIGVGAQAGSDSLKGVGSANVKLIEVETGAVLFPGDRDAGAPVGFESQLSRAAGPATTDRVRAETILGLSEQIGRLFYPYRPSDLERLGDGEG